MAVTRFPPSPTGHLHIGGARTALFNWLYARKTGGEMVLRIEDTDRERSTRQATDAILESMKWLCLTWDQGPLFQTQRFDRYRAALAQLIEHGDAYYCFCSKQRLDAVRDEQRQHGHKARYDGHCRDLQRTPEAGESAVIRFRNPQEGTVKFDDVVRGTVEISNAELDDLIIARTDGSPTYNLTVVVDDMDMGISHVIRGDDHLSNTPRQINIFKALGAELPVFAHIPLILGEDGQRLSKRHDAASVLQYRAMGILPEALLNYLVRLGWSHGDQEIFSVDEMIELFDIADIQRSAATFNLDKLLWINRQYLNSVDLSRIVTEVGRRMKTRGISVCNGPGLIDVVQIMRQRVRTLEELVDSIAFLYQPIDYDQTALRQHVSAQTPAILEQVLAQFRGLEQWEPGTINAALHKVATDLAVKFRHIAQPLRIAVSGSVSTPSIDVTLNMIGRDRTLERVENALEPFRKLTRTTLDYESVSP